MSPTVTHARYAASVQTMISNQTRCPHSAGVKHKRPGGTISHALLAHVVIKEVSLKHRVSCFERGNDAVHTSYHLSVLM